MANENYTITLTCTVCLPKDRRQLIGTGDTPQLAQRAAQGVLKTHYDEYHFGSVPRVNMPQTRTSTQTV